MNASTNTSIADTLLNQAQQHGGLYVVHAGMAAHSGHFMPISDIERLIEKQFFNKAKIEEAPEMPMRKAMWKPNTNKAIKAYKFNQVVRVCAEEEYFTDTLFFVE
jgi:hypothetical protein